MIISEKKRCLKIIKIIVKILQLVQFQLKTGLHFVLKNIYLHSYNVYFKLVVNIIYLIFTMCIECPYKIYNSLNFLN